MRKIRKVVDRISNLFHLHSWIRFLMLCVLVGIIAGVVGVLFDRGLHYLYQLLFINTLNEVRPGSVGGLLLLLVVPSFGMFLAGFIAIMFAPEVRGGGTDAVIKAFHKDRGTIRLRVPLLKGLCTIFTIGSGGSAGREGPTTQIGAGVGSFVATKFRLSDRDRRILMLAGCAGGLGAVLRAPLGGALFAAEMLYREPDFEHDAIIPGVISSVTAFSLFTAILGHEPVLNYGFIGPGNDWPPTYPSADGKMLGEWLHYAMLSLLCALVAFLMVKGIKLIRRFFAKLPVHALAKPALGGLCLGALTAVIVLSMDVAPSEVMGEGRIFLRQVIDNALSKDPSSNSGVHFSIAVLAVVLLCRIVATGLTTGSGASGGLLFPTLLIGGLTGAVYTKFWQAIPGMPDAMALSPKACAGMIMVAMGGVFCGCNKTPIASLVLISELSGSYGLVVPLMLCCASTYLLTTSFSIDEEQVCNIAESPAHRGDFLVNVLEGIRVSEAVSDKAPPELIRDNTPYTKVLDKIKHSTAYSYPIVDEHGYLVGLFSMSDLRQILNERSMTNLVVASNLGITDVPTVTLSTNLNDALSLFTKKSIDELPVVEEPRVVTDGKIENSRRVVAMLTRHDLMAAYHKRLHHLRPEDEEQPTTPGVLESAQVSAEMSDEEST